MADKPTHEECLELARKLQEATELKIQAERAVRDAWEVVQPEGYAHTVRYRADRNNAAWWWTRGLLEEEKRKRTERLEEFEALPPLSVSALVVGKEYLTRCWPPDPDEVVPALYRGTEDMGTFLRYRFERADGLRTDLSEDSVVRRVRERI